MAARTITNPANNSQITSSVVRNELQLLEDEIADPTSIDPGHLHTVESIDASGTPSNVTFLRGDGAWAVPGGGGGGGDVSGPPTSTDNAIATWSGVDGNQLNDTTVTLNLSTGVIAGASFDGDDNTFTDLATSALKSRTGVDAQVVTGTEGTNGNITMWNADGDLVDGGIAAANVLVDADIGVAVQAFNATLAAVAAGTYTGDDSITTVGTIGTGVWNATNVGLGKGGTGASLADPNADRILFWDDSAGQVTFLTVGSGLTLTDTTLTASGGGGGSPGGATTNVQYNDTGAFEGDARFSFDSTGPALLLGAPEGNFAIRSADGAGGTPSGCFLNIFSGGGTGAGFSAPVVIQNGAGAGNDTPAQISVGVQEGSDDARIVLTPGTDENGLRSSNVLQYFTVVGFNTPSSALDASGAIGNMLVIENIGTAPDTGISGAGAIFVEAGALKYMAPGGLITTIAPAS